MQIDKLIKKVFNRQFIWSKNVFIQVPKRKRDKMQLKKCGPSSNCLKIEKNQVLCFISSLAEMLIKFKFIY